MKKKILTFLVSILFFCICAFSLVACGSSSAGKDPDAGIDARYVYDLYVVYAEEMGATPLSYEEWVDSIRGEDGADGKSAYELYCEAHPEYEGTLTEWLDSLINLPYIGENGNWWVGDTDTGVKAPVEVVHEWGEWIIFVEPNCRPGLKVRECLDCGETQTRIMPEEHAFEVFEGREPTCTDIGWEEYQTCSICGHTTYEPIEALGHEAEWVEITAATCTEDGVAHLVCNTCEMILDTEVLEAPGHESDGEKCINCGLYEYTITIDYVYTDGTDAFESISHKIWQGEEYLFTSPELEDYLADINIVSGVAEGNVEIVVTYSPMELQEIVSLEVIDLGTVGYNTPFSELALPSTVIGYTSTGRTVNLMVYWTSETYDPTEYGEQTIMGVVLPSYGYIINCDGYTTATLSVENNVIAQVNEMDLGRLPINTTYAGLGLPTTASITTTAGETYYLPVAWNEYDYDATVEGEHVISGTILLEEGFSFAEGVENLAQITFELSATMYGTADIVFIVDTTGSMWGEIQNVKNNIVRFAERLESEGVSVRWALLEYRDITCDGDDSTKIIYCGASEWYIDVHTYEQAIARLNVSGGGDREETVIDALKAATYLDSREDAKTFYIVVTDADYKVNNNYGVSSMNEMINELVYAETVTSVVTKTMFYNDYRALTDGTNGILANIDGDFASELWRLCDLIAEEVVYGDVDYIEIVEDPNKVEYVAGDYFDGTGMLVRAYFESGLTRDVTGYSVNPYGALQVTDTAVEINYRGKVAYVNITVEAPEIPVNGVSVDLSEVTLYVGEQAIVVATVYPEDAINKNVVWTTMNPNVAVVSNGVIEAIGEGVVEVIVTTLEGGYNQTIMVNVIASPIAVEGIITNVGAVEISAGESVEILYTTIPFEATNQNVEWTSMNSSVATVYNGVVTGVSSGSTTIVVTTEDGGYKARVLVVVSESLGDVTGRVYSSTTGSQLADVTVNAYRGGSFVASTTTDYYGVYTFDNLGYGTYEYVFEKSEYIAATLTSVVNGAYVQNDNVYLVPETVNLPGVVTGYARNASNNAGISDIDVYVRSGSGNTTGTIIDSTTTGSSGYYTTGELLPGNYTLQFVDNSSRATKFISTYINVTVMGDTISYNNDASMALAVSAGTMRVVLTWGASPSDLDSHLKMSGSTSGYVYYNNKNANGASLDVDDRNGAGPETITITLKSNTVYTYYIMNYSGEDSCKLQNSNAKVQIYIGDQVYTFNVPNGTGPYWKVFTYNTATGEFVFHNQLTSSEPTA